MIPYAIIRGANGRRHEVDFGDATFRVEIHTKEDVVEIFLGADFQKFPEDGGVSPLLTFAATCLAKLAGCGKPARARNGNVQAVSVDGRDKPGHDVKY